MRCKILITFDYNVVYVVIITFHWCTGNIFVSVSFPQKDEK